MPKAESRGALNAFRIALALADVSADDLTVEALENATEGAERAYQRAQLPDTRPSGTYQRPLSATLEAKAASVRALAAQVAAGELTPKRIASLLESLAQGIEVNAGEVLALEARR